VLKATPCCSASPASSRAPPCYLCSASYATAPRQCSGSEKSDGVPEHKSQEQVHESYEEETKNLRKLLLTSKVVNPFTRALAPPFIAR
jgi:hypothetical protein